MVSGVPGERARSALSTGRGSRFADVRWVDETGSTNADLMALARGGGAEGIVLVADHQTAGRGRAGRSWSAPAHGSLLMSVLLRPPAGVVDLCTTAMAVAVAEAVETVAGFAPRLKWPNDLVWPGDGSVADRKLAGILAEADWPSSSPRVGLAGSPNGDPAVVVVGVGVNVTWPAALPDDLADVAVACNHITTVGVDREDLLIAVLRHLDEHYSRLLTGDRAVVLAAWRARSGTLGRRVRVDLGSEEIIGVATGITDLGHLVVTTEDGPRSVAVGDVVHLRPN